MRVVTKSSWSSKESTGPVDFFRCFSSFLRASAPSFPLSRSFQNNPVICLIDGCDFLPESGVAFTTPEARALGFAGVLDKPGTSWGMGTAVNRSTNEAGQLAEQLGGPKRDSPSNNPLWVPHKVGMIWLGRKTGWWPCCPSLARKSRSPAG